MTRGRKNRNRATRAQARRDNDIVSALLRAAITWRCRTVEEQQHAQERVDRYLGSSTATRQAERLIGLAGVRLWGRPSVRDAKRAALGTERRIRAWNTPHFDGITMALARACRFTRPEDWRGAHAHGAALRYTS